ncbi:hypothetical protein NC653_039698 [Populus alba x Populus x berolinensis]|uniref:Transmembrane protein n=1 Tax=Populus alba x Populus x berolinensis TaxID=444605 RepID=A0AAD6LBS6_9ROSI|nr:hypothetical protein NC653_039698 [Populus alba x Populus x berolinensis]
MEDWSTSYLLPLLSPLFLLFSDRFLPVRPLFCVCFVLLWPSVFARLLCIIFVLASVFLFVVFGPVFSVYYLRLLCVRSSLFFLGFFRSFVLSAFACFPPAFPPPSSSSVRSSWCVFCVFCSPVVVFCSWIFSVLFVLSVRPLVLSVCSQSPGLRPLRPPPSSWRPFFLWLYSQRMPYVSVTYCIVGS